MKSWTWLLPALLLAGCQQQEGTSYRPTGQPLPDTAWVFGVHPYVSPQDLYAAYGPILRHLERELAGTSFRLEASRDFQDFELKLRDGRLHFALPNPYQALWSVKQGYRIIAKVKPDSVFTGVIVARADSGLADPAELRGRTLSFPAPTALAATLMPLLYLHDRGLDVHRDLKASYVGTQYSAILNAYAGDTAAAGVWRQTWDRWSRENPDKAGAMRVVWETPPLPNLALVVRADVPAELAARVVERLAAMDRDPLGQGTLHNAGLGGFEPASAASYAPVAEFLERYDRLIGLPPAMKNWRVS